MAMSKDRQKQDKGEELRDNMSHLSSKCTCVDGWRTDALLRDLDCPVHSKSPRPVTELLEATMRQGYKMMTGCDPKDYAPCCCLKLPHDPDCPLAKPQDEEYTAAAGPATLWYMGQWLKVMAPEKRDPRPGSQDKEGGTPTPHPGSGCK